MSEFKPSGSDEARVADQNAARARVLTEPGWLSRGRLPSALERVLVERGFVSTEAVDRLLVPSLRELRDPFLIKNMDKAVDRLLKARSQGESVAVYADFDLDGTSGLALLTTGLRGLGFQKLKAHQPLRLSDGYGFHASAVEALAAEGVSVVVTVDVGITGFEACARAKALGVDAIVTDHHLPLERLPDAYCIVNPNHGNCTSGLGHLSGAGVALYLFFALRKRLREKGETGADLDPKELLDVFTIGTLTDMVPVVDENRALLKHGLIQLAQTKRPALQALLEAVDLDGKKLKSEDVGFSIAPKLNALSRLEEGLTPFQVLAEMDLDRAQKLSDELLASNDRRKALQADAEEDCRQRVDVTSSCIWVWSKNYHKGVIGLVATRMAQEFGLPAFIGSETEEGNVFGSARLPPGHPGNLVDMMSACASELLQFGGHAQAAGFRLKVENVAAFGAGLQAAAAKSLSEPGQAVVAVPTHDVDVRLKDLNLNLVKALDWLEPFGKGFAIPKFRLPSVNLASLRPLKGGKHLKLEFEDDGARIGAIYFFAPVTLADRLKVGGLCEVIGEIQANEFRGNVQPQLRTLSVRPLSV